jgi:hypothetical protein
MYWEPRPQHRTAREKETTTLLHSCASTEQAANKGQEHPGSQAGSSNHECTVKGVDRCINNVAQQLDIDTPSKMLH